MRPLGRMHSYSTTSVLLRFVYIYASITVTTCSEYGVPIEIKLWDTGRTPLAHMVDVTNEFGLKVLAEHNFLNDNNIAFSPYGLMGIMVALYEGVEGESSYQIQRGMQLPWNRNVMRIGFRDIHRTLKTYFVPEEGFLAGLALNNENVTFNEPYKKILRFYGFDLENDQLPTLSPETNGTTNETSTTLPSMGEGGQMTNATTMTASTSENNPIQGDTSTVSTMREETTNPNAETISTIDIRGGSSTASPSSAPNAESTPMSTVVTSETTSERATEATTPTMTTSQTTVTTQAATNPETEPTTNAATSTAAEEELTSLNPQVTNTNEPSTNNEVDTSSTSVDISTMQSSPSTEPSTVPVMTPSTEPSTVPVMTPSTEPSTVPDMTPSTEPSTVPDMTRSTEPSTVSDVTPSTQTTTDTSTISSTISTENTPTESVMTSMPETQQTEQMSTITMDDMTTATANTVIPANESTLETLERRKKSIVDFIFTNPPYLNDYTYYRSYDIGLDAPGHNFNDKMFLANGLRSVQVTYMRYDTVLEYAYLPHLEASALKLPLDSDRYYLLVVLPTRGGAPELGRLLSRMARESDLSDIYSVLRPRRVKGIVPSFTVKGHVTLTTDLQKLGIRDVFEPRQRDFTLMTRQAGVYVRSIEQAVSVAIRKYRPDDHKKNRYVTTRDPVVFSATYPFLYFVMDANIHVALMAGKMVDPLNSRIL